MPTTAVQELAAELLPTTPELASGMAEHLYAAIPDLAAIEDEELRAELRASSESNIAQVLRLLADGAGTDDVVVPHEALEFLRGTVRRGIPLPSAEPSSQRLRSHERLADMRRSQRRRKVAEPHHPPSRRRVTR